MLTLFHATPAELHALSTFLRALEPPARLHCVRCHKGYFEVENDDRSCTMAHDDESAEVEHVGYGRSKAAGAYETRWECCGKTVEGAGDLGPPSGWCYEGKHTMDRKRARYRNDSTVANDLLESCETRGCHRKQYAQARTRVPIADDARSTRSARSVESGRTHNTEQKPRKRTARKRSQKAVHDEDGGDNPEGQDDGPTRRRRNARLPEDVALMHPWNIPESVFMASWCDGAGIAHTCQVPRYSVIWQSRRSGLYF
ncbi:hypothetical protein JB92DRAFT_197766 [Gautieria morchelliformis]|nr:hypothetical protein JB92DRAFT_197766 [Gautieria morchelliformis]